MRLCNSLFKLERHSDEFIYLLKKDIDVTLRDPSMVRLLIVELDGRTLMFLSLKMYDSSSLLILRYIIGSLLAFMH